MMFSQRYKEASKSLEVLLVSSKISTPETQHNKGVRGRMDITVELKKNVINQLQIPGWH